MKSPIRRRGSRRARNRANRRKALGDALTVLADRERRILRARRLADDPITLEDFGIRIRHLARTRAPDRGARVEKVQERCSSASPGSKVGRPRDGAEQLHELGSAETKFSSFELFAARIVSGALGGTAMIQVRSPICPYCRQPMKLFRTVSKAASPLFVFHCSHCNHTTTNSSSSHPFATFPQKSQKKRAALAPSSPLIR